MAYNRKEYDRKYRQEHRERLLQNKKEYWIIHKDEILERRKTISKETKARWDKNGSSKYRKTEKGKLVSRHHVLKYRAQKRNQLGPNPPTTKNIQELLSKPCAYCSAPSKHIDHIIPLSRGGLHDISNVIGACAECNQSKGDRLILEWVMNSDRFHTSQATHSYNAYHTTHTAFQRPLLPLATP